MPCIDYILLLGCNLGNTSTKDNFAATLAKLTQGGNPVEQTQSFLDSISGKQKTYKSYPTAVIAADGNTACRVLRNGDSITGLTYQSGKYADHDNHQYKYYVEGEGFCVYEKGIEEKHTSIPGTQAVAARKGIDTDWIEYPVTIEYLLREAKKIIQ